MAVELSSGTEIIASLLEANVCFAGGGGGLSGKLTLRGACRKAFVGTLLLKDVEQQFFRSLLRFYFFCVSYLLVEVLTK